MAPLIPQFRYTDRSRHEARLGQCPRRGYLSTAAGPSGCGLQPRKLSVPMATGTYTHHGIAACAEFARDNDEAPPADYVRHIARDAVGRYALACERRGLSYWGDNAQTLVSEQCCLIAGFTIIFGRYRLPQILETSRIVMVETEAPVLLSCTCGLDLGAPLPDHTLRGCAGVCLQTRADFISQHRDSGQLTYHEAKTQGVSDPGLLYEKFTRKPQLAIGASGAEQLLGQTIEQIVIEACCKGQRRGDYDQATGRASGPERQGSPLCYVYRSPANPPLSPEKWQARYEWEETDPATGILKKRRLGKGWEKQSVLTLAPDLIDAVERAVTGIFTPDDRARCYAALGPYPLRDELRASTLTGMVAEEERLRDIEWDLYTLQAEGHQWASPELQGYLDAVVPCSWNCEPYGKKHGCSFIPICHREPGWEDPVNLQRFEVRRPHHTPELEQLIARGVPVPDDLDEEEE